MSAARRLARWRRIHQRVNPGRPLIIVGTCGERVEDKLLEALEAGLIHLRPGELTHTTVLHDDTCPALRGRRCGCDPDVVPQARGVA